jgi:hypothetical protein
MSAKVAQCWSCLNFLEGKGAISLDGGANYHVCLACWKKIPVYRRVQLQLMSRPVEDGGLGVRAMVERFLSAVDSAEDDNGRSIWPGRN